MTRDQSYKAPTEATLDAFVRIVGEDNAIRDAEAMAPYLVEWRDRYHGKDHTHAVVCHLAAWHRPRQLIWGRVHGNLRLLLKEQPL